MKSTAKPRQKPRRTNGRREKAHREKLQATIAALDRLRPKSPQGAQMIELLQSWLADESGYDETTWPKLKKALETERTRSGARSLFDG